MRRRDIKDSSIAKFLEAYKILASEVYIPEKYRAGYVKLLSKVGNMGNDAPTKIKLLQHKIGLDRHLIELAEEIYKRVKLKKYSSET